MPIKALLIVCILVVSLILSFIIVQTCSSPNLIDNLKDKSIPFSSEKWQMKKGHKYIFRDSMLYDLMNDDDIRSLKGRDIFTTLGIPDRSNELHLYYRIEENKIGAWNLHTTTLVIQLNQDSTINWMKIHN